MSVTLSEHLPLLATAKDGIQKVRDLILRLAVEGKITYSDTSVWMRTTLGEIGEWGSGGTPLKAHADYYGGTIPWLVIGDLNDGLVKKAETHISDKGLANSSAKLVPIGTLLIAMYGSIGKLGIAGIECATNQAIAHCKVHSAIAECRFLFYFVRAIRGQLLSSGQGLAQQNISQKILKATPLQLPPLAEQHRIVAKVDELMALCDRLEAEQSDAVAAHERLVATLLGTLTQSVDAADLATNWQRIAEHFDTLFTTETSLDALKQTILQLAVIGKLVLQDPNDEPASELLKRIAEERGRLEADGKIKKSKPFPPVAEDEQFVTAPSGWAWCRLQSAFDVRDGTHDSPKFFPNGMPFLTSKNIYGGKLDLVDLKFISESDHIEFSKRSKVDRDDILFAMIGSIGNPVIVDTDLAFSFKNMALFKYFSRALSSPQYLQIFLSVIATEMKAKAAGGVQSFVALGTIRNQPIALPPLAEQHRIVAKVDELMVLVDHLKANLAEARAHQERLATTLIESALKAA